MALPVRMSTRLPHPEARRSRGVCAERHGGHMYVSAAKALALLRIGFGLYFTSYGLDKIMACWLTSAGPITGFLFGNPAATPPSRGAVANAIPFYADFLNSVVQPNAQFFSYLVALGEFTAGVLLTLGLLT